MSNLKETLNNISVENIEAHIRKLEGIRHPVVAPEALKEAYKYIWENLSQWGYEMENHRFVDDGREFKNIIGTKTGTQEPEKKILVTAHFDTVSTSPGANDNASGVAALLELARVFRNNRFKRSILFIGFDQEEQRVDGQADSPICRGSRALADHAATNEWEIEGIVNFEEIGYAGEEIKQNVPEDFPVQISEVGNFVGIIANEKSVELVKMCVEGIEEQRLQLPYETLVVPGNGEFLPDTRRSDHAPFWDKGYKAVMLTDTANFRTPHYHQPSDTIETINLAFVAEVCRAGGCLLSKMAEFDNG